MAAEVGHPTVSDPDPSDNVVTDMNRVLALDLGSAPAPYPTSVADDGARHGVDGLLHLGSSATEDDGVVFVDPVDPGATVRLEVSASAIGRLDAWVDLDRDGDWDGAAERVLGNVQVSAGVNHVSVSIPPTAIPGPTWARFRLSRLGGLEVTGVADHGEVEDHRLETVPVTLQSFRVE